MIRKYQLLMASDGGIWEIQLLIVLVGIGILVAARYVAGKYWKILDFGPKLTMLQKGWLIFFATVALFIVAILTSLTGQYNAA